MRIDRYILLFLLGYLLVFAESCKETPPEPEPEPEKATVTIRTELVQNGVSKELDEVFTDGEGNAARLVALKFYLADLTLVDDGGNSIELSEIELFDHKPIDSEINTPQWEHSYTYDVEEGVYEELRFGLGVPGDLNGIDPATYSNDEALSIYSNMYWSWASMYRFIIMEAQMDTTGGNALDHDLIFHTGTDDLYRGGIVRSVMIEAVEGEDSEIVLEIDWDKLFYDGPESIDINSEHTTHTTDTPEDRDLAIRFTENFVDAITVK